MKTPAKMSSEDRRTAIIRTARRVFVEKGFHRTTTRELAEAVGVSEALLFKHFPSKEALYSAIQMSCFKEEGSRVSQRLEALRPSTESLVWLVRDLVSRVLGKQPDEDRRAFLRLILRSLMDEGEFARLGLSRQGGPSHSIQKVEECLKAARAAGDAVEGPVSDSVGGWCAHHVICGFMMHFLPLAPVIDYGIPREELVNQVSWFCLRGMGLTEEAIGRCYQSQGASRPETTAACSAPVDAASSPSD
jgi:AcrR family transcriptional regulator